MSDFMKRDGEKTRSVFPNEFNKFNNTGARMKDFIYCIVSCDTKIAFY